MLAFWTTTLEVAADAWRIELAPTRSQQGPIVAANLWGYRSAMVAAGSGAIYVAARTDWTSPISSSPRWLPALPDPRRDARRSRAGGGRAARARHRHRRRSVDHPRRDRDRDRRDRLGVAVGSRRRGHQQQDQHHAAVLVGRACCRSSRWRSRCRGSASCRRPHPRAPRRRSAPMSISSGASASRRCRPGFRLVLPHGRRDGADAVPSAVQRARLRPRQISIADGAVALLSSMVGVALGGLAGGALAAGLGARRSAR